VQIRKITDEEIEQFDQVHDGLDWGFYPDPADYGKCHYDAARRTLYLFMEYRAWKKSNWDLYQDITRLGVTPDVTIIADSAEPKSVADFRAYSSDPVPVLDVHGQPQFLNGKPVVIYGPSCRGAEKGPESVKYSIKWLQGLNAIVIDPQRCPYSAEEFLNYEYEQDPDGNFISEYPDKNNHSIDRVRYSTNMIWRRRGQ
jgi:phage terminase large subunit